MSFGDHMNAKLLMERVAQPVSWEDLCKDNPTRERMLESALQKGYVRKTDDGCYCFTTHFLDSQIDEAQTTFELACENLKRLQSLQEQLKNH